MGTDLFAMVGAGSESRAPCPAIEPRVRVFTYGAGVEPNPAVAGRTALDPSRNVYGRNFFDRSGQDRETVTNSRS